MIYDSILDTIGRTPVVRLNRIAPDNVTVYVKCEFFNPLSSVKDRLAIAIIEDAERRGTLKPGQTVIEATSGNTGIALAMVCAVKGYPFVAVMSRGNSVERARMMSALGAEVVLVDQLPGSRPGQVSGGDLELVEREAKRIVSARNAFRADQFRLLSNVRAHYLNTGPEFIRQSGGRIDAFCDFAGTGGTFAGCAAAFKEFNPAIQCFLVEPEGAAALAGEPVTYPAHRIQGGGYSMTDLPLLRPEHIDGYLKVSDSDAIRMARRLAREEGIFAGFSSGANVAAAFQLLESGFKDRTVAVVMCDSGLKYLSTDLWD